jgi:chain length determinant protein EpsF
MSLHHLLEILKGRYKIAALILFIVLTTTLVVSLLLPKQYTARATLVVDIKGVDPVTGHDLPAQLLPGYMGTQIDVIRSHIVALKVVDGLKLAEDPEVLEKFKKISQNSSASIRDWVADDILKKLIIKPSRESNVVQIEYNGGNPHSVAALVNKFAESYVATSLELKTEPAKQYALWYKKKIKDLRDNLESAHANLTMFQQKTGFVAIDEHIDVETAKLRVLAERLTDAQLQALDARTRRNQLLLAGKNVLATTSPDVLGNSLVQNLKLQLANAEAKQAEVAEKYYPNDPRYRRASAEVQALREKSDTEIRNVGRSISMTAEIASKREKEIEDAYYAQKVKVLELSKWKDKMAVLVREVEHAQETYISGLKQFTQTELESQVKQTNVAILDPAVPPLNPSKPNLMLNMAVSAFIGTLLGLGVAFLLELFDRRIRSIEDLTPWLDVPIIGVLGDKNLERYGSWSRVKAIGFAKEKGECA